MLEVVTPAATFDLTTVDAVNAELGIDSNTANDGLISGYISAASDSIARYCKRILVAQEYAETFYTNTCKNELLLSEYPVAEIASIEENGVPAATLQALMAMGHDVRMSGTQGSAQTVWVHPNTGMIYGVADKRSPDAKASKR